MKNLICLLTLFVAMSANAEDISPASKAATADMVTTAIGFQKGYAEGNPVLGSTIGIPQLVLITAVKVGASEYFKDNEDVQKGTTTIWGGAAARNIFIILGYGNPASTIIGLITGTYLFNKDYCTKNCK
jgi:hypothetical protein